MKVDIKEIEYLNIEILKFYIENIDVKDKFETFGISVKIDTRPFLEKGEIITSKIDISVKAPNTEEEIFNLSIGNVFRVSNIKEYLIKNDEDYIVKDELKLCIADLVLSTTRGIFWEKTRGTFLHNVMFPIMDIENNKIS